MIVLYHPRAAEERFRIPLSVLTVAASVRGAHEVRIVDGDTSADPIGEIRGHLRAAGGRAVLGVSVMPGPQLARAVPHTRRLKVMFPDVPIVWGGWFPSAHAGLCLSVPYVDVVVRGRADVSFPQLARQLLAGDGVGLVPGISYRDATGAVRHNPPAPQPPPDDLPPLPYGLVDVRRYHQRTWLGRATTGAHTSYGCPLKCGFCAVAAQYEGRWLAQSVPRLLADVDPLLAAGADAIEFFDNNFFVSERRVREVAAALAGRAAWWGEGTIDGLLRYKDDTLRAMRDGGCRMIFFGAESGSDATLALYNKNGLVASSAVALAERLRRFDIVPEFSFVLGSPIAPRADIEASIALIRRIKGVNPDAEIILYLYSPEPYGNAALWEAARAAGFRHPEDLEAWAADATRLFNLRRAPETPWLADADLRLIRGFETVLGAWSPGVSDIGIGPRARRVLRALATPRYRLGWYDRPVGLDALLRALRHRRVEQEGL